MMQRKEAYHYQLLHHIHAMEMIRLKFGLSAAEHDKIIQTMITEERRKDLKNQERLKLG